MDEARIAEAMRADGFEPDDRTPAERETDRGYDIADREAADYRFPDMPRGADLGQIRQFDADLKLFAAACNMPEHMAKGFAETLAQISMDLAELSPAQWELQQRSWRADAARRYGSGEAVSEAVAPAADVLRFVRQSSPKMAAFVEKLMASKAIHHPFVVNTLANYGRHLAKWSQARGAARGEH